MNIRRLAVAPVLAAFLAVMACTNPFAPTSTSTDTATVQPEVKTVVEQFVAKVNERDAGGAGEFYADDPGFHWVENGRILYDSRASAINGLTNFLAGFPDSHLEVSDIRVDMLGDEAAVATMKYRQTVGANGQTGFAFEGYMTLSMLDQGDWKIMVGHASSSAFPR